MGKACALPGLGYDFRRRDFAFRASSRAGSFALCQSSEQLPPPSLGFLLFEQNKCHLLALVKCFPQFGQAITVPTFAASAVA